MEVKGVVGEPAGGRGDVTHELWQKKGLVIAVEATTERPIEILPLAKLALDLGDRETAFELILVPAGSDEWQGKIGGEIFPAFLEFAVITRRVYEARRLPFEKRLPAEHPTGVVEETGVGFVLGVGAGSGGPLDLEIAPRWKNMATGELARP